MARPRAFDTEYVLQQATDLFWLKGYEATTLDELDRATGLHRGSLYNAFGDKRGLYLAVLDHYGRREVGAAVEMLTAGRASIQAIHRLFMAVVEAAGKPGTRRGCLLCNTAIELAPHDAQIAERVVANLEPLRAAFSEVLASHPELQGPGAKRRIAALSDFLTTHYMGLLVLTKAGYAVKELKNSAEVALSALP